MSFPSWVRKHLEPDSPKRIEEAVAAVERLTACEVVPMIVRRSSATDHIPKLLFCFFLTLFFALDGTAYLRAFYSNTYIIIITVLISFSLLSITIANFSLVQRLMLSEQEMERQVHDRAELEFYRASLQNTQGSTGILLFFSLLEQKVVVLADKAIAEKLPANTWDSLVHLVTDSGKRHSLSSGILAAIKHCGEVLPKHFPPHSSDINELKDYLIIKE